MAIDPKLSGILADVRRSRGRVVALTGAGISAESGIRTFRDSGGLWEEHSIEDVATPRGFARDPDLVQRFYNERRRKLRDAAPNAAHRALAGLEARLGDRFVLITQNVDDLHERGGSRRVIHMHGELLKARCVRCGDVIPWTGDIGPADRCRCGSGLRPHVVWFEEMPLCMEAEIPAALRAEVFVSIGTSGVVYPAAGFVSVARSHGAITVEVNLEPTDRPGLFDFVLAGKATEKVPELAAALLGESPVSDG
jgi:NAD-dependent deacetylase